MPVVKTHFRISVRGIFVGTPEIWQYGLKYERDLAGGADTTLSDVSASAVETALKTFHGQSFFCSTTRLTEFRVYQIGTDGLMEGNGPLLNVLASAQNGGGSAFVFPPSIACVVTLVSNNRGPAKFGRVYLPGPSAGISTDGRMSTATAGTIGTAFSTMLDSVGHAIDAPGTTQQTYAVNISDRPIGTGTKQQVDHVEVGRVLDNLRTRRNAMVEAREIMPPISWDLV